MLKRTWKKHYIGLAVPQSMVIEMDNAIWHGFMKMHSVYNEISNRLSIGIDLGQFTRNYTQTTKRGLLTTNKG